jgi:hypothetical protein
MVSIPIVVDGVEEVLMRRSSFAKDFVRSGFHKNIMADLSGSDWCFASAY